MARVFVTGGTGFTGPSAVKALIARGHTVVCLCRSEKSAEKLRYLGGIPVMGDIKSLKVLKEQAEQCDGVVHMAFDIGDSLDFLEACRRDKEAIEVMCKALEGTGKPFVGTTGTLFCEQPLGSPLPDETFTECLSPYPIKARSENERYVISYKDKGVKAQIVRLSPTVHGEGDLGFIPMWMDCGKKLGYVPYYFGGECQWTAVNKADAGELFALAYDKGEPGSIWHGAAENISHKSIAEAIGKKLGIPTKGITEDVALPELGFVGLVIKMNAPVSFEMTKKKLGWKPTHNTLLEDITEFYN